MPNFNFMRDWADIALDPNHESETDPWLAMQWQSYAKRYVIAERYHAIRAALGFANDGDAVLILGKGAQDYHIVGAAKWWFDDWCEATDALRVLGSPSMANLKLDMKQLPYRMQAGKRRERKGVGGMTEAVRGGGTAECVPAYIYEDYEAYPEEHNFIDRLMEQDDEIYGVERWEAMSKPPGEEEAEEDYKPVITEEMLRAYARERAGLPPLTAEEMAAEVAAAAPQKKTAAKPAPDSDSDYDEDDFDEDEEFDDDDDDPTAAAAADDDDDDDDDDANDDDDDDSDEDEKPPPRGRTPPRRAR